MSGYVGFSYCLCCHTRIQRGRLLCFKCDEPLDREPKTEWGKARKAERAALASTREEG